jgi:hypothetical protein
MPTAAMMCVAEKRLDLGGENPAVTVGGPSTGSGGETTSWVALSSPPAVVTPYATRDLTGRFVLVLVVVLVLESGHVECSAKWNCTHVSGWRLEEDTRQRI